MVILGWILHMAWPVDQEIVMFVVKWKKSTDFGDKQSRQVFYHTDTNSKQSLHVISLTDALSILVHFPDRNTLKCLN